MQHSHYRAIVPISVQYDVQSVFVVVVVVIVFFWFLHLLVYLVSAALDTLTDRTKLDPV